MDPIQKRPDETTGLSQSPFVTSKTDCEQEIQFDQPTNEEVDFEKLEASIEKAIILGTAQFFIVAALIMAGCGLLIRLFGGTDGNTALYGFRSATLLLVLGLMASCENSNKSIGRIGYYLSLVSAVIFGLNFLRLGYKWFDPSVWWRITPLLAVTMGSSAMFAFYKVCSVRRDRAGVMIAVGSVAVASAAALRLNEGQGLAAVDSTYTITLFFLLIPIVMYRFRYSIFAFFREKIEFAPIAIAGLLIIAGTIKVTTTLQPQGVSASAIKALLPQDDPEMIDNQSKPDQEPVQDHEQPQTPDQTPDQPQ